MKKNVENKRNENIVLAKIKGFFNNPAPLIIVLIAIICVLLLFISRINVKNKIYVGLINSNEIQIANVHYFTNSDMNYFYASNGLYNGTYKDTEVYSYQMGYYVVDKNNTYHEFATRSKMADTPATVSEIVDELSGWSIAEAYVNRKFFTNEVINNMDNLHFVIKASTKKGSDEADINLDFKVNLSKITKN